MLGAHFDGYTVILLSSTAESTVWFGAGGGWWLAQEFGWS